MVEEAHCCPKIDPSEKSRKMSVFLDKIRISTASRSEYDCVIEK